MLKLGLLLCSVQECDNKPSLKPLTIPSTLASPGDKNEWTAFAVILQTDSFLLWEPLL